MKVKMHRDDYGVAADGSTRSRLPATVQRNRLITLRRRCIGGALARSISKEGPVLTENILLCRAVTQPRLHRFLIGLFPAWWLDAPMLFKDAEIRALLRRARNYEGVSVESCSCLISAKTASTTVAR